MQALRTFRHLAVTARCPNAGYQTVFGHSSTMSDDAVSEFILDQAEQLWDCSETLLCNGETHTVEIVGTDPSNG